jgi:hypothetical protein
MAERSEIFNRLTDPPKKRDTAENRAQSAADFVLGAIRGAVKSVTTDIPGFLMDAADQLAGQVKSFGEKDRSEQLFSAVTGTKKDSRQGELVGSFMNPIAATQAIIAPAFLVKSLKQVKKADQALREGIDAAQVEKYTGIFRLPENVDDGVLRAIIDDSKAKLRYSDSPAEVGVLRRQSPINSDGPSMNVHIGTSDIRKLPEVLDHPELFAAIPELKNTRVINEFGGFRGAAYFPDEDIIRIASDNSPERFLQTLLHETQHAVQTKFNMNPGGSPRQFLTDPQAFKEAKAHIDSVDNGLMELFKKKTDPESVATIMRRQEVVAKKQQALRTADNQALESYFRIAGEREASAVEAMRAANTRSIPSMQYYGSDLDRLISDPLTAPKTDSSAIIQTIINRALNEAARKN